MASLLHPSRLSALEQRGGGAKAPGRWTVPCETKKKRIRMVDATLLAATWTLSSRDGRETRAVEVQFPLDETIQESPCR